MPRLTSFSDEHSQHAEGNVWQILADAYKPVRGDKKYIAFCGDRQVTIGRNSSIPGIEFSDEGRTIRIVNPGLILEYMSIQLPLKTMSLNFTIKKRSMWTFVTSSETVTFQRDGKGIEVKIEGVGRAWSRNVWRDSDISKRIAGFVHTDCVDPFDEEALVWLVGALSRKIWFIHGY